MRTRGSRLLIFFSLYSGRSFLLISLAFENPLCITLSSYKYIYIIDWIKFVLMLGLNTLRYVWKCWGIRRYNYCKHFFSNFKLIRTKHMNITLDVEMSTSTDNVNITTDATVWCFVTYTDSIIAHFGVHLKSSNRKSFVWIARNRKK